MRRSYADWKALLADEPLPTALVDLDAVDHNVDVLVAAMEGTAPTLRVASKSVRHPWLMRYILDRGGARMRGLMTFSAHEAVFLVDEGFDDLLMGYPFARPDEATAVARLVADGSSIIATVDQVDQLPVLARAASNHAVTLPVCIDIDASWRPLGGRVHFGVRRSPVRDADGAVALARAIADTEGLELTSLLAYEAQIAGIQDVNMTSRHLDPIRRVIKERSRPVVLEQREAIVSALHNDGHRIEIVNGGGTGSIDWTARDPTVTEVTAGSGFLCPHLFDGYRQLDLQPAAFFALSVVRASDPGHVTCAGGGYIASGPPATDRLPVVHAPAGLEHLGMEGFGEVQTPLAIADGAARPAIGDPVVCRHAKSGEVFERFAEVLLVRAGGIVDRQPSYRGHGKTFL